jgi:hypothetical protein
MRDIHDKIGEAHYFLARMSDASCVIERLSDFKYNLRAFLSSTRGILFMLRKGYSRMPGFRKWIREVEADPHLRFLRDLRDADIHRSPVTPGYTITAWSPVTSVRSLSDGSAVVTYRSGGSEWRWTFDRYPGMGPNEDEDEYVDEYESEYGEPPSKEVVSVCRDMLYTVEKAAADARSNWPRRR